LNRPVTNGISPQVVGCRREERYYLTDTGTQQQ